MSTLPDVSVGDPTRYESLSVFPLFSPPEGGVDYLLSDDPLARTNGLKRPDGHLAIPISPRRLAVGVYEQKFLDEFRRLEPRELVRRMNIWTVEGARHFVVSTDRKQTRFIANRFGRNPKPGFARIS